MKLPQSPFLYPILDSHFSKDLIADARALIEAGIEIFQIRAKEWNKRQLLDSVNYLLPECNQRGVRLIVNDHVDVALLSGAHGVHLGQDDFPVAEARNLLPNSLLGISTHNQMQFVIANEQPADYIAIGPVYETQTKAGSTDPALGIAYVRHCCKSTKAPVVCIGGIGVHHLDELIEAGAGGIAMISAVYKGGNIFKTVSQMQKRLDSIGKFP